MGHKSDQKSKEQKSKEAPVKLSEPEEEMDERHYGGVLPNRDLKKNLGCGG